MAFRIDLNEHTPNRALDPYKEFDNCLNRISGKVDFLKLNQSQTDSIYNLMLEITEASFKLIQNICSIQENSMKKLEGYVQHEIKKFSTSYKRNKLCENSPRYVRPADKVIGFQWASKFDLCANSPRHSFKQNTFQYISIKETLERLCENEEFLHACKNNGHTCTPVVFERFCCGKIYHESELYRENPDAFQLLFAIDEFEPCEAVKTKAGIHKICAVYMQILNLPKRLLSKHENIFLVALSSSIDLHQEFTELDNVIEIIVSDIKKLETIGIKCGYQMKKGTIACFTFDNAGGNELFGFVKSFRASHYCRICQLSSDECSQASSEHPDRIRKIDDYNEILTKLSDSQAIHLQGIKKNCPLNDLKYFHIIQNKAVDLMHDLMEGVIPFLLKELFSYCLANNIYGKNEIVSRVRDFNYGHLFKDSKPSILDLNKNKLNQNASQAYCLMVHIPFIFHDQKDELNQIWAPVRSLLGILQILFSYRITENDVRRLEQLIEIHLKSFQRIFNVHLKPKHHFLTHYPSVIRSLGPVRNFWMMRMESKHKFFTDSIKRTNNFINLPKSLAVKHQQIFANGNPNYGHDINESKIRKPLKSELVSQIENIDTNNLYEINSLWYDGIEYRCGLLLANDKYFYGIKNIISDGKGLYLFAYVTYEIESFDTFCHSFKIISDPLSPGISLTALQSLKNKNSYEIVYYKKSMFIKAQYLDFSVDDFL